MKTNHSLSEVATSAFFNQQNRPVAFYSRTLNASETRHSSVEKEASAIVEAVRKWSHFLQGCKFTLVTDQKSVSFMYDNKRHSKVKNEKILQWKLELSQYDYDIIYRVGKYNSTPDALSLKSLTCLLCESDPQFSTGNSRCVSHPGVTR